MRSRGVRARWLWALMAGVLGGCSGETEPRTQLMLVADTDVASSGSIHFEIVGPDERREPKDSPFAKAEDLPRTLALVYTEGELGPFTVSASIKSPSGPTITRTHVVSFVRGKTLLVPLHLAEECARVQSCSDEETCDETAHCVGRMLSGLASYEDTPERTFVPDGSTSMDASVGEDASVADGGDGDGDSGANDGDAGDAAATDYQDCSGDYVDLQSNPDHCGSCDFACSQAPANNATGSVCTGGICQLACNPGFYDCMGRNNGCETPESSFQTSKDHCGGCNRPCKKCVSGACME